MSSLDLIDALEDAIEADGAQPEIYYAGISSGDDHGATLSVGRIGLPRVARRIELGEPVGPQIQALLAASRAGVAA